MGPAVTRRAVTEEEMRQRRRADAAALAREVHDEIRRGQALEAMDVLHANPFLTAEEWIRGCPQLRNSKPMWRSVLEYVHAVARERHWNLGCTQLKIPGEPSRVYWAVGDEPWLAVAATMNLFRHATTRAIHLDERSYAVNLDRLDDPRATMLLTAVREQALLARAQRQLLDAVSDTLVPVAEKARWERIVSGRLRSATMGA
jgi:hypothetical protein